MALHFPLRAIPAGALLLTAHLAAQAAVTRFTVEESRPYGNFNGVDYVQLRARVQGTLAPTEHIADIARAPLDTSGRAAYATTVVMIVPHDPARGNGALVLDVPNRGLPIAHAMYNSSRARPLMMGSLDGGTGFLQSRGFAVASVHWELGEGIEVPRFTDEKGVVRHIEGTAFAVVRDVAAFLRSGTREQGNPLASSVRQVYGVGYSQTARFLKTFVLQGFNQADGRPVFDGLHLFAAAAGQIPLNTSGTGPKSVSGGTPGYGNPHLRGVHEEPYAYADLMRALQAQGQPLPRIIVAHTSTDYSTGRASLTRTGAKGTADLPLPDSVRMYDIAGAGHLNVREQDRDCELPHAQLDWTPPLRAQLASLHAWVSGGTPAPASRLMELEAPHPGDASVLPLADHMQGATLLVPRLDADGNPAAGGVRVPDVAVPLGTNGATNRPTAKSVCRLAGSWKPFAGTRQAGDPRPSLQEHYPGGLNEYVDKVRNVSAQLVADRLLLPEDAAVLVEFAATQTLFTPTPVPGIFR